MSQPATPRHGYIQLLREGGLELLTNDPKAFLLLTLIAFRARRRSLEFSSQPLKPRQALIGDPKTIKLTQAEYRRAKKALENYGLVLFETVQKGTIATLLDDRVFYINPEEESDTDEQPSNKKEQPKPSRKTRKNQQATVNQKAIDQPTANQQDASKQLIDNHSTTDQELLTKNENNEIREQAEKSLMKEQETTNKSWAADGGLFPCLRGITSIKGYSLSDEEKIGLMKHPESRVELALEFAGHANVEIRKDLISTLHWHCSQPEPIPPPNGKKFR